MNLKHVELTEPECARLEGFTNIPLDGVKDGVYRLTINRPQTHNALNGETLREMGRAIDILESDPGALVLLITSAGEKSFVAGADIEYMSSISPLEAKAFAEELIRMFPNDRQKCKTIY